MKNKFRKFFTLNPRHEDGFTLVELIVVIAILAILAGVGSTGYAGYIKAANKGNDKVLVGNIMRALETSAYSGYNEFAVEGQFSNGIQIPVGFVVVSNEVLTSGTQSGYTLAISNDDERNPLHIALADAMGQDYANTVKLTDDSWTVGTVGGSNFHNASAGMMDSIDDVGDVMIALDGVVEMTAGEYENTGEMILAVAARIADYNFDGSITAEDKTAFVSAWAGVTDQPVDTVGFGLSGANGGREYYSAVRMAYNNAFAEYVKANYDGTQSVMMITDGISNYGQTAGELATEKIKQSDAYTIPWGIAYNTAKLKYWKDDAATKEAKAKADADAACEYIITEAIDGIANVDTKFPYTATNKAFDDPNYGGCLDKEKVQALYTQWIAGQDEIDAAMFYDTMVTAATDGKAYTESEEGSTETLADWFADQAQAYSDNLNAIQGVVDGKCAVVVAVYCKDGLLEFEIYDPSADPREE